MPLPHAGQRRPFDFDSFPRVIAALALLMATSSASLRADDAAPAATKPHECRFTEWPITIDGKADEKVWESAEIIDKFSLPWLGKEARPAKTATKARLLWDLDNLYFFGLNTIGAWAIPTSQGVLMIAASRRPELPILARLAALLILCQAAGRALSFFLDGTFAPRFVLAFLAELAAGIAVLAPWPAARPSAR